MKQEERRPDQNQVLEGTVLKITSQCSCRKLSPLKSLGQKRVQTLWPVQLIIPVLKYQLDLLVTPLAYFPRSLAELRIQSPKLSSALPQGYDRALPGFFPKHK